MYKLVCVVFTEQPYSRRRSNSWKRAVEATPSTVRSRRNKRMHSRTLARSLVCPTQQSSALWHQPICHLKCAMLRRSRGRFAFASRSTQWTDLCAGID